MTNLISRRDFLRGSAAGVATLALASAGITVGAEESSESYYAYLQSMAYDDASWEIYDTVLGEFYEYYQAAGEASSVSERYALMAIAEAKLLESAVMLPSTSDGGYYATCRYAPRTVTTTGWGTDSDRLATL
ncbi:MAG: twin-arginine translocation signal domain-containing protein, partial [Lachnospiraceae bacterium]|nr:twin-arginine translocation signal domain-containing protein [Lachnospiraceae bacterium]